MIMKNVEKNLKVTRKIAGVLMKIGDVHANELSFCFGAYEPKISTNLLKNSNKDKK